MAGLHELPDVVLGYRKAGAPPSASMYRTVVATGLPTGAASRYTAPWLCTYVASLLPERGS
jgi:hypothetical protein